MPRFRFEISGTKPFIDPDGMELSSAEVAWEEAVRLVRDIEGSLKPGENWTLDVSEGKGVIFRISVVTVDLRKSTS